MNRIVSRFQGFTLLSPTGEISLGIEPQCTQITFSKDKTKDTVHCRKKSKKKQSKAKNKNKSTKPSAV